MTESTPHNESAKGLTKETASAEQTGNHQFEPYPDGRKQMDPKDFKHPDRSGLPEEARKMAEHQDAVQAKAPHQPEVQPVMKMADGTEIPVAPNTPAI